MRKSHDFVCVYGFATGMVYSSRTLHWCRRGHFFLEVSVSRIRWILMRSYCHKRGTASKRYSARGYFFQAWSKRFPTKGYHTISNGHCVRMCSATSGVHNCHVWALYHLFVQLCCSRKGGFSVCCMLHTDIPEIYPNLYDSNAHHCVCDRFCAFFCKACIWSQSLEHASIYF